MTFNASKVCILASLIVFIVTAVLAFLTDAPDMAHLIGGIAIGLGAMAAGGLVA